MASIKYKIASVSERNRLKASFRGLAGVSWQEKSEQYCEYRLDGSASGGWLRAKQFTNGTLYLEASTDALLEQLSQFVSGKSVSQTKSSSSEPVKAKKSGFLDIQGTYIGTDESGKGDYFGPLVVAGVLVTEQTGKILMELGVTDSKQVSSQAIPVLAKQILNVVGRSAISIVEMVPPKYNELYSRFKGSGKNLNHMLAWGHASVIENLLTEFPDCQQAVADQFGGEHYILSQLKEKGRLIKLHQTPRAEANVAVAAASIVARHRFVQRLDKLSEVAGFDLKPGASEQVKRQAQQLARQGGLEKLTQVAKLHFKTTQEILPS